MPDPDKSAHVDVRIHALRVLLEADSGRAFVDEVLTGSIDSVSTKKDRSLLQELTYGCVRHRETLDRLLDRYVKNSVDRQRRELAWALRLGAYQLVYLSRVPSHAAVNQTLEALKAVGGVDSRAIGFANAVLKRLGADIVKKDAAPPEDVDDPSVLPIRQGYCTFRRPVLPPLRSDVATHLAVKHSHPRWLVARWIERFGEEEARELLSANNEIPRLTARVTRAAPSTEALTEALRNEGFEVARGRLDGSLHLSGGNLANATPLASGWMQIQDETSMRIGAVLAPPSGARVLDLCAAPGGKALQLMDCLGNTGHLVALDRSEEKLARLRENLTRAQGAFTVRLAPERPEDLDLGEAFSHVLVDAPCSNTGVLARRPEARLRITGKDLDRLTNLQLRLLDAAYRHVRPGGKLLYATCSIEPEENEGVVARLYSAHPDLTELETHLFLPHRSGAGGGFCSLLLKAKG